MVKEESNVAKKILEHAKAVYDDIKKKTSPHMDIPLRSLSNVQIGRASCRERV